LLINYILPCAGEGSRLGLDSPKELYEVREGVKLVDYSLFHIIKSFEKKNKNELKVSVIIKPGKESVYLYVKEKLKFLNVEKVYFKPDYIEWPGSVYSAESFFSDINIVLLPDTFLSLSKDKFNISEQRFSLLELMVKNLIGYELTFGYIRTNNIKKLRNFGAMRVEDNNVILFKDKPKKNILNYNSFWGCYGFKKHIGKDLYEFLVSSVTDDNAKEKIPFETSCFEIKEFYDLGTWDGIKNYLTAFSQCKS